MFRTIKRFFLGAAIGSLGLTITLAGIAILLSVPGYIFNLANEGIIDESVAVLIILFWIVAIVGGFIAIINDRVY